MFLRLETKTGIWTVSRQRWHWRPVCVGRPSYDWFMFGWLFVLVERLSKEWLTFCEEHGSGLESTFDWLMESVKAEEDGDA